MPVQFVDDLVKEELRVKGTTSPKDLAGSIVKNLQNGKAVTLSCIGHQSIGQAVKSLPIANGMLVTQGYMVAAFVGFEVKHLQLDGEDQERTACLLYLVKIRPR